jgi:hypothetical protein
MVRLCAFCQGAPSVEGSGLCEICRLAIAQDRQARDLLPENPGSHCTPACGYCGRCG